MSQGVPSGLEGQIDSPNSLELLWDKYKRLVYGAIIAVAAAIAVQYAWRYMDRKATDEKWSAVVASSGLDKAYADLPPKPAAEDPRAAQQNWQQVQRGIVGELPSDLASADRATLVKKLEASRGDKQVEPLLLWLLAGRDLAAGDFAAAKTGLSDLQSKYPSHFLCTVSEYPVQWRDEKEDPDADPTTPSKDDPEYVPPVAGSLVAQMIERVGKEEQFRAANSRLYNAVQPTSDKVAILDIADEDGNFQGTVKIRFFAEQAPEHTAAFLKLAGEDKFFDGLRIHNVARAGSTNTGMDPSLTPSELKFGLAVTRDEADQSKWVPSGQVPEEHQVPWEMSPELSHFPGTLSAEPAAGGKSQVERLVINGKDSGVRTDGARVIFGRVVEGLDLIERIINEAPFASETDEQRGVGIPTDRIQIKSVTIADA